MSREDAVRPLEAAEVEAMRGDGAVRLYDLRARSGDDLGRWTATGPLAALTHMARAEGFGDFWAWRRANMAAGPVEVEEAESDPALR